MKITLPSGETAHHRRLLTRGRGNEGEHAMCGCAKGTHSPHLLAWGTGDAGGPKVVRAWHQVTGDRQIASRPRIQQDEALYWMERFIANHVLKKLFVRSIDLISS